MKFYIHCIVHLGSICAKGIYMILLYSRLQPQTYQLIWYTHSCRQDKMEIQMSLLLNRLLYIGQNETLFSGLCIF